MKFKLPKHLGAYADKSFSLQLKARFMQRLAIALLFITCFMIGFDFFIIKSSSYDQSSYIPIVWAELTLVFVLLTSLYLLYKGHYYFASNVIFSATLVAVWTIIFIDKGTILVRVDSLFLVLSVLSMLPLIIWRIRGIYPLYIGLNLAFLFLFIFRFIDSESLSTGYKLELAGDATMAFLFSAIVSYNIYRINKLSFIQTEYDKNNREVAEQQLLESEMRYREMTELLPQVVFESDLAGNLTFVNKKGFEIFGYSQEEFDRGINIFATVDPAEHEQLKASIGQLMQGKSNLGNYYTCLTRTGLRFPVQIYSSLIKKDESAMGIRGIIIDMSNQKRIEEELLASRNQFQSLVKNIPGTAYRCKNDANWTMLYMSADIDRLSGYPSEEFIDNKIRSYDSVIHPDDKERLTLLVQQAINEDKSWELEYRVLHKNGSIRWAYEVGRAYNDAGHGAQYLDGLILDITDKKEAEWKLADKEVKYQFLLENMNDALMYVDHDDRILYVNKKFTQLLGYTLDEVQGKIGYEILLDPKDQVIIKEANTERIKNKTGQYELTFIGKNKQQIDFLIHGSPLRDADGKLIGSVGTLTDITERKKAEKKLKESEERYRKLFEAFPDIIMVSDLEGNVIYGNEQLEKVAGIAPDDYRNKNRKAGVHPDDRPKVMKALNDLLKSDKNFTELITNRFIDKWGKEHWFSGKIAKLNIHGNIYLQTISRDITEAKATEEELEKYRNHLEHLVKERTEELQAANEELIAANEELQSQSEALQTTLNELNMTQNQLIEAEKMASLGVLSAGVAHEINNPLNFIHAGIVAVNDYFNDNLVSHLSEVKPMIDSVVTGVERVSKIVTSLNHFSRQHDTFTEEIAIVEVLENCLTMLQNQIKYRITVEKDYTQTPFILLGNEGKLHQAFLNILSNACHAIPDKGFIAIQTYLENQKLYVSISDNGIGIKPEYLNKIFNPFFTTKDPGKGTGLGLAITYKIINEHQGTISYTSNPGQGTKALVCLPLQGQSN